VTRRSLIQRALLLLGIEPVALIGCASRRIASEGSRPAELMLDQPSESGALSTGEMESLAAFGEVLVEGRALPPAERRYLLEHIEDRTRSPEYLSLYRGAASTLDRLAGRRFASLEVHERIDLIARYRLAAPVRPGENLGPFADEIRTLQIRTTRDLIRGYYASPAGWAVVSYDSFPGRCGDLTRYTRPEA
jgi:hypothetical protein